MPQVVDGHLHLFRKASAEFPRALFPNMAEADREELAEKLLRAMETAGVDHAIVVPLSKGDEYLREVLAAFPGRFAGVGIFDHDEPDDVAAINERLAATDLQGLRFYGLAADEDTTIDSLGCFPIFELMAERGMVVWFYGDIIQLRLMDQVMQRLPELKVVLNHSGFLPDMHAEMRVDQYRRPHFDVELPPAGLPAVEAMAAEHPNLHVHFSGHYAFSSEPYPYRDLQGVAERLVAAFGAERMLMASDWPWIEFEPGYSEVLGVLDHLLPDLSTTDRDAIRGGTALSLFRF
jgi:predicted TIM-barrel fold metal-dependent hydrolase